MLARSDKGGRKGSAEYSIKIEEQAQNNDQAFISALNLSMQSTDNGDSITFNGNVTSSSAATSRADYAWTLPSEAQGGSNGHPQQRFTVTKNKQVQNLKVKVKICSNVNHGRIRAGVAARRPCIMNRVLALTGRMHGIVNKHKSS